MLGVRDRRADRAVFARRALARGAPLAVVAEDVVDDDREVVAGVAQVNAVGRPGDDPVRQRAEVRLVRVREERQHELLAQAVAEHTGQCSGGGPARDRDVDERREGLAGRRCRGCHVAVVLADGRVVVVEGQRSVEVRERAREPGGGDRRRGAVEVALERAREPDGRAGEGVGVDLAHAERRLVVGERGHLGGGRRVRRGAEGGERVVVRHEHGVEEALRDARRLRGRQERVGDDRPGGVTEVDLGVRHALLGHRSLERVDGVVAAGVARHHDQRAEVEPLRRRQRLSGGGRDQTGRDRDHSRDHDQAQQGPTRP